MKVKILKKRNCCKYIIKENIEAIMFKRELKNEGTDSMIGR